MEGCCFDGIRVGRDPDRVGVVLNLEDDARLSLPTMGSVFG